jgi:hypothetical protein
MRVTIGRAIAPERGAAARPLAFDPTRASRVGPASAFTRFKAGADRIAAADGWTMFRFTASPCSSVLRETALNPPRTPRLA